MLKYVDHVKLLMNKLDNLWLKHAICALKLLMEVNV